MNAMCVVNMMNRGRVSPLSMLYNRNPHHTTCRAHQPKEESSWL